MAKTTKIGVVDPVATNSTSGAAPAKTLKSQLLGGSLTLLAGSGLVGVTNLLYNVVTGTSGARPICRAIWKALSSACCCVIPTPRVHLRRLGPLRVALRGVHLVSACPYRTPAVTRKIGLIAVTSARRAARVPRSRNETRAGCTVRLPRRPGDQPG